MGAGIPDDSGDAAACKVLLEAARDPEVEAIRGRIHFVCGSQHRLSGWIFLEWSDREIEERFSDFSAQELWNLLDSIAE